MTRTKLKSDKYRKSRGGYSRLLELSCAKCGAYLFSYQKDGPGILKRLYLDRIISDKISRGQKLTCQKCKELLGVYATYKKENRPSFRLFAGAISKKIKKAE